MMQFFSGWPNRLTLSRLCLVPVTIMCYYFLKPLGPWSGYVACFFFVIAALTDWVDGWVARRYNHQTELGGLLDQVVDKVLVTSVLIVLVSDVEVLEKSQWKYVLIVAVIVIVCREILMPSLRQWMMSSGRDRHLAVAVHGKIKTVAQMTAIAMILFGQDAWGVPIFFLGELLLYFGAIMTLISMVAYLRKATEVK